MESASEASPAPNRQVQAPNKDLINTSFTDSIENAGSNQPPSPVKHPVEQEKHMPNEVKSKISEVTGWLGVMTSEKKAPPTSTGVRKSTVNMSICFL